MASEIAAFMSGVLRQWVTVAGGAAVAVALLVAGILIDPLPSWSAPVVFIIALVLATFLTWRDEYRERLRLERAAVLAEVEHPVLVVEPGRDSKQQRFEIVNTSSVDAYNITVELKPAALEVIP